MKTKLILAGMVSALALTGGAASAKDLLFGINPNNMAYPYDVALVQGFQEAADKAGVKVVVLDPKSSVEAQANQFDDMLTQGVDGIGFMPNDSVTVQGLVDKIAEKKIPIVAAAVPVGDPNKNAVDYAYPNLTALVSTNDVIAGQVAGELAVKLLTADMKARAIKIAVVEGAPGFAVVKQREDGFEAALTKAGVKFTVVASQPTDWTPESGESVCQNMLTANPDIDLIYSHADPMAVGCARAVDAVGSKAILVATGGGSTDGNNAIAAGELDGSVCTNPKLIGELTFKALYEAVQAGDAAKKGQYITYDLFPVTKDNLKDCPAAGW